MNLKGSSEELFSEDKCLDFGPGIGRFLETFSVLTDPLSCYDISIIYKDRLLDRAKALDITIDMKIGNGELPLPYSDKQFDLCIATMVLLHIAPNNISKTLRELSRISKKVLITSYYDDNLPFISHNSKEHEEYYTYVFNYNYLEICKENDLEIETWQMKTDSCVFFTYS